MGEPAIRRLARELLTALAHLHANGFVHADVKPANMIRRASDGSLVLIDLGMAQRINPHTQLLEGPAVGSPLYEAPELRPASYGRMLQQQRACEQDMGSSTRSGGAGAEAVPPADARADVWSAGVVLAECCGVLGDVGKELPYDLPEGLYYFLSGLLRVDPSERPTAEQALGDPYLAQE
jgi:serine/threonine protein kinase